MVFRDETNAARGRLGASHSHPPLPGLCCAFDFTIAVAKLQGMVEMSDRLEATFIANVRARMEKLGINQSELAERMGVGRSFVSQMLSGYRRPGLESLEAFAVALDMEPADLLRERKMSKSA